MQSLAYHDVLIHVDYFRNSGVLESMCVTHRLYAMKNCCKAEFFQTIVQSYQSHRWMDGWMTCKLRPFQQYFSNIRPRGYKKNSMLTSAEHEICPAHKY